MTEEPQPSPVTKPGANRGVKQGLPTLGLRQAEDSAQKLWGIARRGETSKEQFAKELGNTVTSSTFKARMATLNGFGLIKVTDAGVALSDQGLDLVQEYDEELRRSARRKAVLTLKAYREVVQRFDNTELLPKDRLASKFQFEYGKNEDFAARAADALIDSLELADMLTSAGIVHLKGTETANGQSGTPEEDANTEVEDERSAAELDQAFEAEDEVDDAGEGSTRGERGKTGAGLRSNVNLTVSLDLSNFEVDDVVTILRALGLASGD